MARGMTEAEFRRIVGNDKANKLLAGNGAINRRGVAPPAPTWLELPARWELPMPPSLNKMWSNVKDSNTGKPKRILSEKARAYRKTVASTIKGAVDPEGLYTLRIVFYYPWFYKNGKLNRFDETNRIKLLEDCIAHVLGVDDSHFKRPDLDSIDTTRLDCMQAVRVYLMPLRPSTET